MNPAGPDAPRPAGLPLQEVLPRIYPDLRRLAQRALRAERSNHTLQATALVHEVYLQLARQRVQSWTDSAQVLSLASCCLRRILVDHARSRGRHKRGWGLKRSDMDQAADLIAPGDEHLISLDDALACLAVESPRAVQVVEMRYFGGCSSAEIAQALGITTRTVERDWHFARAWLFRRLSSEGPA